MRALLRDLPSFTPRQGTGKNRIFTRVELLAITVISSMEQKYGIKRTAISTILDKLLETLQTPREVDPFACLLIITGESRVLYKSLTEHFPEGLVVPLAPIFDQLDTYLGVKSPIKQIELGFGPSLCKIESSSYRK